MKLIQSKGQKSELRTYHDKYHYIITLLGRLIISGVVSKPPGSAFGGIS